MAQIGRPLDEWQALMVRDTFGVGPDGLWAAFETLVLLSRQNGKGGYTEAIELGGLFLFREPLILHSAHQFKTSTAAFRRLQDIIDGSDWLTKRVKMVSRSKGDESIELTRAAGGGRLQFVARTLGSGRGLTGSKNVFDEAWALTVGQYAAQTPTLATLPNPQIIYTTTPPDDDIGPLPEDAMLPSVRKRGHAGAPRIACYEWSPPDGFDRTDRDVWYECNPALGIRISEWFLAQQLDAFTAAGRPEKFDTEHLGVWPPDASEQWQVVPEQAWRDSAAPDDARPAAPIALAVEVTLDRSWASIGLAGRRDDGLRQVELVEHRPGTGWVVGRVKEITARTPTCTVVVAKGGPAASLIADLEAAEVEVMSPSTAEFAAAAGAFYDGLCGDAKDLRHLPSGPLTAAVAGAAKRALADGAWTWGRLRSSVDVSPLMAVTLALHGFAVAGPAFAADYDVLESVW